MHERLKQIRASSKKSQQEFAKMLGIGQSTLAMMEVGKREISERHIKTICAIFNVNEEWLRTGAGEMFEDNDDSLMNELSVQYGLEPMDKEILRIFLELSPSQRQAIKKFAFSLVDSVLTTDSLYTEYREDHLQQDQLPYAARSGNSKGLEELVQAFEASDEEKDDKKNGENN